MKPNNDQNVENQIQPHNNQDNTQTRVDMAHIWMHPNHKQFE